MGQQREFEVVFAVYDLFAHGLSAPPGISRKTDFIVALDEHEARSGIYRKHGDSIDILSVEIFA